MVLFHPRRTLHWRIAKARVGMMVVLAGCLMGNLCAQIPDRLAAMGNVKSLDSRSGQFVVSGATSEIYIPTPDGQPAPTNCLRLDPGVVIFTCERVKDDLLRSLRAHDEWRGRITISLRSEIRPDGPMVINSVWSRNGWHYQVQLPYYIDPTKLVRAAVRSLLLEMANRGNRTPNLADVPLWLQEGLAHELLVDDLPNLILQPRTGNLYSKRQMEPLQAARLQMAGQAPLSFSDLSLPTETELSGEGWDNYCANSHLFVAELLALKNGPERVQDTLRRMPDYLNPQLAFLGAFSNDFHSTLAVEKWWSLAAVNLSDRDQYRHWTPAVVVRRLDEILNVSAAVRIATNAVPDRQDVALVKFVETSEYASQKIILLGLVGQLDTLIRSCPPEMGKIVIDYRRVLVDYLQKRASSAKDAWADKKAFIQQIKTLDVIREDLRHYDPTISKSVAQSGAGK